MNQRSRLRVNIALCALTMAVAATVSHAQVVVRLQPQGERRVVSLHPRLRPNLRVKEILVQKVVIGGQHRVLFGVNVENVGRTAARDFTVLTSITYPTEGCGSPWILKATHVTEIAPGATQTLWVHQFSSSQPIPVREYHVATYADAVMADKLGPYGRVLETNEKDNERQVTRTL